VRRPGGRAPLAQQVGAARQCLVEEALLLERFAEDDAQLDAVRAKRAVYAAAGVSTEMLGPADVAAAEAMHQTAPRRQRDAAAIERDVGKADAIGAFALKQ